MTPFFAGSEPVDRHVRQVQGHVDSAGRAESRAGDDQRARPSRSARRRSSRCRRPATTTSTEAWKDNVVLDYAGVRASELSGRAAEAALEPDRALRRQHGRRARAGEDGRGPAAPRQHVVRVDRRAPTPAASSTTAIHSPVILIEFDHQVPANLKHLAKDPNAPNPQHIHVVVRTPNGNDYGKDLLRQHYVQHSGTPGSEGLAERWQKPSRYISRAGRPPGRRASPAAPAPGTRPARRRQHHRRRHQRRQVAWFDGEQHPGQSSADRGRDDDPEHQSEGDQAHALPHHEGEHVSATRQARA